MSTPYRYTLEKYSELRCPKCHYTLREGATAGGKCPDCESRLHIHSIKELKAVKNA